MSPTKQERNKALVLEAFDTLFNKRDYLAAERFWSPNYIQHSAHIAPGREGLFNLIKSMPPTLRYEPGMIVADGDLVIVHGRFSGFGRPRTGSRRTSSESRMASLSNTGTSSRTRRLRSNPRAVGRCSATRFRNNAGPDEAPFVNQFNDRMAETNPHSSSAWGASGAAPANRSFTLGRASTTMVKTPRIVPSGIWMQQRQATTKQKM